MSGGGTPQGLWLVGTWALLLAGGACATAPRKPPCPPHALPSSAGRCVPEAWHCSPALYGAGPEDGCDCDCGAPDPDCHGKPKTFWCYGLGMARPVTSCALCGAAPGERLLQQLYAEP